VLAWRLSNTMDVAFCLEALDEAMARFGRPELFNTDQGSQFTSAEFTGRLEVAGIRPGGNAGDRRMDELLQ
jgi:putative transposase